MKLGDFEIYSVLDGFFRLDGGAMFGRAPKEVWKKINKPDRQNRILMALRCLLVKTGKHNILIDTGVGAKHSKEFIKMFAIRRLAEKNLGVFPEDIDMVINTHLHFDHAGGNTKTEGGKIVPAFPKAKYFIQRGEWNDALGCNPLARVTYNRDDFLPLKDFGAIEFIDRDIAEITPGITLIKIGGHTKYHQIVKINSGNQKLLYLGDLVPMASHLHYLFTMAYDLEPLETMRQKMSILPKAARDNTLLVFGHEPKFDAALVWQRDEKIFISHEVKL